MAECEKCTYRLGLAKLADIHVWGEDCDRYGTRICETLSNSAFASEQEWTKRIRVRLQSPPTVRSYGERKENDN